MLLRSSSTPVLGSLIPSIAESPNNNHGDSHSAARYQPAIAHHGLSKFSFHHHHPGSLHLSSISCNSPSVSPSVSEFSNAESHRGFRRAQSEGNLEGLLNGYDDLYSGPTGLKCEGRSRCSLLETIPSFSAFNLRDGFEDWEEGNELESEDELKRKDFEEDKEFEEWICGDEVKSKAEFDVSLKPSGNAGVIDGMEYMGRNFDSVDDSQAITRQMYLAVGLGIGGGKFGGGGGNGCGGGGSGNMAPDNGGNRNIEDYYKEMVEKNPGDALFLRNYAQFLYLTKHDLQGAEEYYSRAILADPNDGEILAQYAKLIWKLHHDHERAVSYFQRAVRAASEDSHVHAAYANFLWEVDEHEEDTEEGVLTNGFNSFPQFQHTMTSATA